MEKAHTYPKGNKSQSQIQIYEKGINVGKHHL